MYDAPFDTATVIGWTLCAAVAVLLVARAVRTEVRPSGGRALDAGIGVLLAIAIVALLATLAVVVVGAFA